MSGKFANFVINFIPIFVSACERDEIEMALTVRDYDSENLTTWLKLNGMPENVYSVIKGNFI